MHIIKQKEDDTVANMEDFLNKAKDMAETAGQKTSGFVDTVRLKMEMADTEKQLAAAYEGMGRLIADARRSGTSEDIDELIENCTVTIDELQEKLNTLRQAYYKRKNFRICQHCDAVNDDESLFCKKCGHKLTETSAQAAEEVQD